jgi:hypothetical protein
MTKSDRFLVKKKSKRNYMRKNQSVEEKLWAFTYFGSTSHNYTAVNFVNIKIMYRA